MSLWDKVAQLGGPDPARQTRQAAMRTAANALVFGESDEAGVQVLRSKPSGLDPVFSFHPQWHGRTTARAGGRRAERCA